MAVFTKRQYRALTGMRVRALFVVHLRGTDQSEAVELFEDLASLCLFVSQHCPEDIGIHAAYGEDLDESTTELWLAWNLKGGVMGRAKEICDTAMSIASKP